MDFCGAVSYPTSFILLMTLNPISEPCHTSPAHSAPPQGDLQPAFTSSFPVHHLCKTIVQTLQGLSRFSSVTQSCLILCYPMHCIMPGLPVHHQLPEYPNSCPLSWRCHPTISSSVVPFSSGLQSFPASGSFQMSQFFASDSQSIGVSLQHQSFQ